MPIPTVKHGKQSKERSRTKSGRWRKKRSDAGEKRVKKERDEEQRTRIVFGVEVRLWTEEDDRFVMDCYGRLPTKEVARVLKRTLDVVRLRAYKLGLGGRASHFCGGRPFKVSDEQILRKIDQAGGLVVGTLRSFGKLVDLNAGLASKRLRSLELEGKVHVTRLNVGATRSRGGTKYGGFALFNGVCNTTIIWSDEQALVRFLKEKLCLSPKLPRGFRSALTHQLKKALPKDTFLKVHQLYSRRDD